MDYNKRILRLSLFFGVIFLLFVGTLGNLMLGEKANDVKTASFLDRSFAETMDEMIARGAIRERDGEIVADKVILETLVRNENTRERITAYVPYVYSVNGKLKFDASSTRIINRHVRFQREDFIRGRFLDRNGVVLAENILNETTGFQKRQYAFGAQYFPLIGFANSVYGEKYLEDIFSDFLDGRKHEPVLKNLYEFLDPFRIGDDIVLTIDCRLQQKAYDLIGDGQGAIVMLKVDSGEILACVSKPSFNPNSRSGNEWFKAERDIIGKPFENRALRNLYFPGSIFKVVVAAAWIESEEYDKDFALTCYGYDSKLRIGDIAPHGIVDIEKGLAKSCNVFFSEIGVKVGTGLTRKAEAFGFGGKIDLLPQDEKLDFKAEASTAFSGIDEVFFKRNPKLIAQGAIGQNLVKATPIQMAMVVQSIANNGVMNNPYIIKSINYGTSIEEKNKPVRSLIDYNPVIIGTPVKKETSVKIRDYMEEVMRSGTGRNLKKLYRDEDKYFLADVGYKGTGEEVEVAGKTGTSEHGDNNSGESEKSKKDDGNKNEETTDAWFIGFAPAESPAVAIAVIIENGGKGGKVAGPIAMELFKESLNCFTLIK